MATTVLPLAEYVISQLDGDACEARWAELEGAIRDAFRGARFMPGFDETSPLRHTREGLDGPYVHVVAEMGDRIAGAVLRVPVNCPPGGADADPGWFFVAPDLSPAVKVEVADELITQCHDVLRNAGFTAVATNMGTRDGAVFLRHRHGYRHVPVEGQENRWFRLL